ncbi:MAG TPA: metallophosphoesterase [Blastocatellia bacterium]|nr:metallophosphoesterase [Blastocatellia bacterium]
MGMLLALVSSTAKIVILRLVVSVIFVGVQFYVLRAFLRIIRSLGLERGKEKLAIALALIFIALINAPLAGFIVEGFISPRSFTLYSPPPGYERLMRPFAYTFFVWTIGSFFFAAAAPIAMSAFAAIQFFRRKKSGGDRDATVEVFDLSRRRFLQMALLAAASMPFAISAYGAVAARSRKVVERVIVPIAGLPPQLDGLTVAQLSDVHSGLFMKERAMGEYVAIANGLNPDVVALTGDFVSTNSREVAPFIKAISGLKAKYGVYGCLGNHDIFTDSVEELESGFSEAGFKLLRNANEIIDVGGAKLNVIGVDFMGYGTDVRSLNEVLKGVKLEGTSVLLLHAPYQFPEAAKAGIHLTLSGHTHGGQIALSFGDWIITPARLATIFLAGLFKIGDSHLYVNRGLGTTGPPIRIGAPPEITHITLKAV